MSDPKKISERDYSSEFVFQTSRSSGAGGQHVNKVETRVTLKFSIPESYVLNDEEKNRLLIRLKNRISSEGVLSIHSEKHRSQLRNKEETVISFNKLLVAAFTDPKPRKKSKPSQAAIRKRLEAKKKQSDKKSNRRPPEF